MKTLKNILVIVFIIGLAATAGSDYLINTARLDGFIYGNKSGGIDTIMIPATDSLGQYSIKNVRDPLDELDAVNYRTLLSAGGGGVDSVPFNPANGNLDVYFAGVNYYTTNLDDRYIEYSDTNTIVITPSQLADSLAIRDSTIQADLMPDVYTLILPVAGTLAGSIAAMTSVDNPYGWSLNASGTNLIITHNLDRYCAAVTVSYNSSGTIYRQLVSYQNAFNTIQNDNSNSMQIISISNYYSQYKLRINLIFE